MADTVKTTDCLNCNHPYPEDVDLTQKVYCSQCGQANNESRLSIIRLLQDAVSNFFNLDSRLIHTFRDLFFTSKLTRTYIEGKRKYYVNPVRLFIFTLLGLITLAIYSIKIDNTTMGVDDYYSKTERSKLMEEFNALIDTIDISGHEEILDSIKGDLFFRVKSIDTDTLGKNGPNFQMIGKPIKEYGITRYDGLHLSKEELFKKYEITDFWGRLNVAQYIRIITDPAGGIKYIVKNLTWAVFITVILLSLLLKLLYIRHNYYLVEHIILVLNAHAILFVIIAMVIIVNAVVDTGSDESVFEIVFNLSTMTITFIIQYLTLKKYYKQGVFKTLVKMFVINSAYLVIFNSAVFLVTLISLLLY